MKGKILVLAILLSSLSFATAEIQLESSKIRGGGTINPLWKRIMARLSLQKK
ncbi:hypothetical protein FUSO3_03550 [Fusobacterium necrophorum BL]|uniref:Uncharacterized protein n=1 Tax=Fusobacterium necrophorum BL TaxID=1441732 RepID=A0AB73BXG3_9FUSO|nr:hypothetical protein [Fusobacterium necrophorum]KDE64059.1 hypothetical protein FUSO3_03550 [Fusobacterium necrophorum BL]